MSERTYVGTGLELFAAATRWKSYLARQVGPYLGARVLEVGAGLGGTTRHLCRASHDRWVCLEPDPALASQLAAAIAAGALPACCEPVIGTLASLAGGVSFDSVLYIDVLEHIEDDQTEVVGAAERLEPGGYLVVLAPAHPVLFTPFDRAIGHHRRYTKVMMRALTPGSLELVRLAYLDAAGLLASLGNRLVLRSARPGAGQVAFWDRVLVRASTVLDPCLGHALGKSVLGVWRRR